MVIQKETVGLKMFVESHGLEFSLPQARDRDDEFLEVDLGNSTSEIVF
jgi:hypothetical protein